MAFEYMGNQLQGPNIDINLFSQNATAGINAGNALPSTTTAIIQGALKGIGQGQEIASNQQTLALNQNKIDQLPVQNAQEAEQLRTTQIANDINSIKRDAAVANKDAELDTAKIDAENQLSEAKQKKQDLDTYNKLSTDLSSPVQSVRQNILNDPTYSGFLLKNPKLYEAVAGKLVSNGDLNKEQQDGVLASIDLVKKMELDRLRQKDAVDLIKVTAGTPEDMSKALAQSNIKNVLGVRPSITDYFSDGIQLIPHGTVPVGTDGKLDFNAPRLATATQNVGFMDVVENGVLKGTVTANDASYYDEARTMHTNQDRLRKLNVGFDFGKLFETDSNKKTDTKVAPSSSATPSPIQPEGTQTQPQTQPPAALDATQQAAQNTFYQKNGLLGGANAVIAPANSTNVANSQAPLAVAPVDKALYDIANKNPEFKDSFNAKLKTSTDNLQERFKAKVLEVSPVSPTVAPSPATAIGTALKQNVSFNIPEYAIKDSTYQRINNEPLLSNQSPLIKGMAAVESVGRRNAMSPIVKDKSGKIIAGGVKGLLQVTKATAGEFGLNRDIPAQNVLAGQLYLTKQIVNYDGDLRLALTAYNTGPGYVDMAIKNLGGKRDWESVKLALKDIVPAEKYNKETVSYADKVLSSAARFVGSSARDDSDLLELMRLNNIYTPKFV